MNTKDNISGTGLTTKMVRELPDNGAIIITTDYKMVNYIKNIIYNIRGKDYLAKVLVKPIRTMGDIDKLRGMTMPVFVDHSYWEETKPEICEALKHHLSIMERKR